VPVRALDSERKRGGGREGGNRETAGTIVGSDTGTPVHASSTAAAAGGSSHDDFLAKSSGRDSSTLPQIS
jgi:hypothetical protein